MSAAECWCNGEGGRGIAFFETERVPGFPNGWDGAAEYCSCPAGQEREEMEMGEARGDAYSLAWAKLHFPEAKVPRHYSEFTLKTSPADPAIVERARSWVTEGTAGAFLYGPSGTGKTGLAVGMLKRAMVEWRERGRYVNVPELLASLRAGYGEEGVNQSRLIQELQEVPHLILDDIGVDKYSDWVESTMYALIGPRHSHQSSTIFTSNYSVRELATRIGERNTWRIIEMSSEDETDFLIRVDGTNHRDKRSLKVVNQ